MAALAGVTWYFQFFFYSMGQTKMGKYDFSSWTLHMASIMIFGTVWGLLLGEWKGSSTRTYALNAAGLVFGSVSYAVDYTCTNIGIVTWQSPAAGTHVNRGAAVSVRIGTAPRPPRECT